MGVREEKSDRIWPPLFGQPKEEAEIPCRVSWLGVDPGADGGLAVVCSDQRCFVLPLKGATERDIANWLRDLSPQPVKAYIEKVWAMPGNGSVGMFKFGQSYGFLRGCLISHSIAFDEVPPQRWQKGLGIVGKRRHETKLQFKRRLRAKAEQLYPDTEFNSGTADAALISTYCQQEYLGL